MKLSIWNSFVAHETKSNQTIAVNETWARTKNRDTTTLLQKVSSTVTMKMQVSAGSL
jgi:hypothetical protein